MTPEHKGKKIFCEIIEGDRGMNPCGKLLPCLIHSPSKKEVTQLPKIDNPKDMTEENKKSIGALSKFVENKGEKCETCAGSGKCQHASHFIQTTDSHSCEGVCEECNGEGYKSSPSEKKCMIITDYSSQGAPNRCWGELPCSTHSPSDTQKTEGWEEEFYKEFPVFANRAFTEDTVRKIKDFFHTQIALAENRGYPKGYKDGWQDEERRNKKSIEEARHTAIDECVKALPDLMNNSDIDRVRIGVEALLALKKRK